jgi:hypothetical protein
MPKKKPFAPFKPLPATFTKKQVDEARTELASDEHKQLKDLLARPEKQQQDQKK